MNIVPIESQLEIEAMLSNRDIGFLSAGQSAEVKIDTFNFTRYGLLHGVVTSVSQDAIIREKPVGATGDPFRNLANQMAKSFSIQPVSP